MKVVFENNMRRGRGYAFLRFSEVANPSSGGWRFSLCRGSDTNYLGRSGWQNSEDFTEPETFATDGDDLILHIGPDVVDRLDSNENYRVTLQSDSQSPQRATFAITALNRTLMDTRGNISSETAKKTVAPPPQPEPVPEPEPLPAPDDTAPSASLPPEAPKKSFPPKILAALLALAILGGAAFWFITKNDPAVEPPLPGTSGASGVEQPPLPDTSGASGVEQPPPPLQPHQQAQEYLNANPTAQGAVQLAAALLLPDLTEQDQDAVYRLWYFAAGNGDVAANFHLAQVVDPALPAWGTIRKDGAEAWSLYATAAPQQPEAANAMHALKQWMEKEAEKGNSDATGWIRKIAEDSAKK